MLNRGKIINCQKLKKFHVVHTMITFTLNTITDQKSASFKNQGPRFNYTQHFFPSHWFSQRARSIISSDPWANQGRTFHTVSTTVCGPSVHFTTFMMWWWWTDIIRAWIRRLLKVQEVDTRRPCSSETRRVFFS